MIPLDVPGSVWKKVDKSNGFFFFSAHITPHVRSYGNTRPFRKMKTWEIIILLIVKAGWIRVASKSSRKWSIELGLIFFAFVGVEEFSKDAGARCQQWTALVIVKTCSLVNSSHWHIRNWRKMGENSLQTCTVANLWYETIKAGVFACDEAFHSAPLRPINTPVMHNAILPLNDEMQKFVFSSCCCYCCWRRRNAGAAMRRWTREATDWRIEAKTGSLWSRLCITTHLELCPGR